MPNVSVSFLGYIFLIDFQWVIKTDLWIVVPYGSHWRRTSRCCLVKQLVPERQHAITHSNGITHTSRPRLLKDPRLATFRVQMGMSAEKRLKCGHLVPAPHKLLNEHIEVMSTKEQNSPHPDCQRTRPHRRRQTTCQISRETRASAPRISGGPTRPRCHRSILRPNAMFSLVDNFEFVSWCWFFRYF